VSPPVKSRTDRRGALVTLGAGFLVSGIPHGNPANAGGEAALASQNAKNLREFSGLLAGIPRRRDYKTVPMVLDDPQLWDGAAIDAVLAYTAGPKQAWDNTELAGSWLKGMRNSLNVQVWSFKETNFLCVSATHGSAHLALFDQHIWDRYQLPELIGRDVTLNTFVSPRSESFSPDGHDLQSEKAASFANDLSITTLQQRGVVFMACHNAIWELAELLVSTGRNPDRLPIDAIAAELSNHLIPDVVLTPGIVATLVRLQHNGFAYSK
jgi:hypothetical protein